MCLSDCDCNKEHSERHDSCDRDNGQCTCDAGYYGRSCDKGKQILLRIEMLN